jgi:hypothetical protein
MSAFILVCPHLPIAQLQEDALLIEWAISVDESETFDRNFVEGGDAFHSMNDINPR